jgi:tRNA (guanine37-N1)-methyltransferase
VTKHYDVITLFPEMFDAIADSGVTRRALDEMAWDLQCWNPRDFAQDKYRTIDDRPFGGGPGMVMKAEPLNAAIDAAIQRQRGFSAGTDSVAPKVVYLTPQAQPIRDQEIRRLAAEPGLVFLCGRYEGIDERLIEARVDLEVSIGDYILSGGELAAMVVIDAMVRLLPGVLNAAASADEDSFSPSRCGWLDHPHYTRPEVWNGRAAPDVLMGGNHAEIAKWRHRIALERTWRRRPDLVDGAALDREDLQLLAAMKSGKP